MLSHTSGRRPSITSASTERALESQYWTLESITLMLTLEGLAQRLPTRPPTAPAWMTRGTRILSGYFPLPRYSAGSMLSEAAAQGPILHGEQTPIATRGS